MSARKPAILVIDDSPEILFLFEKVLSNDFRLQTTRSASEALGLAMKTPPDLILLDLVMPDTHGFDVFRQFQAVKQLQGIPVIFISGMGDLDNVSQGLALGAADYLVKPFNVNIARQRIINLLEREKLRKDLEEHRDQLQERVAERTRELSLAKEAAEKANQAKSIFLAKMSAELRQPMSAIIGMNDLALRRATDEEQKQQLGSVKQGAQHLLMLIDDLLDISRIEAGSLTLERRPFRLGSLVDKASMQFSREAKAKGLALSSEIAPKLASLTVDGDAGRLLQILHNLLDNAIRFTPQGNVSIRLLQQESTADEIRLRMEVHDTGIGLSTTQRQQLLNGFEASSPNTEGGGLGLAICKRLATMMGGTIGVDSIAGNGSTFWVSVRLALSNQVAAPESEPRSAATLAEDCLKQRHANARLLLAGDEPINREVVAWMLKEAGLQFDIATDSQSALQKIKKTAYDAVLIDLSLCSGDDAEAFSAIRSLRGRQHTTIIGMSEKSLDECRTLRQRLNINELISKPIDPAQLFEALLKWLDNHKTGRELNDQRFQMLADIAQELEGDVVFPICLEIALRLKQQLQKKTAPFEHLLSLIALDPLIACKLLYLANADLAPANKAGAIRDLKTAVTQLGESRVRSAVNEIVTLQLTQARQMSEFEKMGHGLWQHSLNTAAAAYVVGKRLTHLNPDECLLAGLVHDLGAFYMIYRAAKYSELRNRPETTSHLAAQWHESIGSSLLNALKVPETIIDAVNEHSHPRQIPKPMERMNDVVYVANHLAETGSAIVEHEGGDLPDAAFDSYRQAFDGEIRQQLKVMRSTFDQA